MDESYRVVFQGLAPDAESPRVVAQKLAQTFGITPEQALGIVGNAPVVVKKGIDRQAAQGYADALTSIGGRCLVEQLSAPGARAASGQGSIPPPGPPSAPPGLCPSCGYQRTGQEISPPYECPSCGVAYEKHQQMLARKEARLREQAAYQARRQAMAGQQPSAPPVGAHPSAPPPLGAHPSAPPPLGAHPSAPPPGPPYAAAGVLPFSAAGGPPSSAAGAPPYGGPPELCKTCQAPLEPAAKACAKCGTQTALVSSLSDIEAQELASRGLLMYWIGIGLAVIGTLMARLGYQFVTHTNGFFTYQTLERTWVADMGSVFGLFATVLLLWGAFKIVKAKGRHWAYCFLGLLSLVGLYFLYKLEDRRP